MNANTEYTIHCMSERISILEADLLTLCKKLKISEDELKISKIRKNPTDWKLRQKIIEPINADFQKRLKDEKKRLDKARLDKLFAGAKPKKTTK